MNRPLIFLFPGQASQYVGMGRDIYEHSAAAREIFARAANMERLERIGDIAFNGPDDLLTRTDNVQPAITLASLMTVAALEERYGDALAPTACAGHSLGEYAAHFAAGNFQVESVLRTVERRGFWMNEASQPPNPKGAMAAVMGLPLIELEAIVKEIGPDKVAIANLNSPGQVIISGESEAVQRAGQAAAEGGAKRVIPLNVSGAWHSPLMTSAQEKMGRLLDEMLQRGDLQLTSPIPVVANATADIVRSSEELKDTLHRQITAPVRWEACVRRLLSAAGRHSLPGELPDQARNAQGDWPLFIEIGPGKVLRGLLRNIDRHLEAIGVDNWGDVLAIEEIIG